MSVPQALERVVVVLNEPQDPVNIGAVVRAMKNMGLGRLRLVRPVGFDPYRVEGVAHTGLDIIASTRIFDALSTAVGDCGLVVGSSGRGRRVRHEYVGPRELAPDVLDVARSGADVALVFGREDRGLSNAELDLCARVVVIPTDPDHPSLNLAQAVLVIAYEIFVATGAEPPLKEPRHPVVRPSASELQELAAQARTTLEAIDFFKARNVTSIMRTVQSVIGRADVDRREVALFRAMAIEVRKFLARHGLTSP